MRGGVLVVVLSMLPGSQAWARPAGPPGEDPSPPPEERREEPAGSSAPEADSCNRTVIPAPRPTSPDRTQDQVVVPGETLRASPKPNLLETLAQESASIHVTRRGVGPAGVASGAAGGLTVRGLGGSPNTQVLVVEDGVPDVQGIFGHPLPDAYVPDLIDEAVVVEGGDSVLYGSNAMGAAIVLRSRWLPEDGWEVQTDASYGSYTTLGGTVTALGRKDGWEGAFALHGMRTDGHRDGAGGSVLVIQSAGRYRPAQAWSLTLRNKAVHVTGGDPGTVQHPFTDHTFDVWRDNLSATLEYQRPGIRVTLLPYATLGRHRLYDGFQSVDWTVGLRGEACWRPHRRWEVLLGLEARDVDGTVEDRIRGTSRDVRAMVDVAAYQQVAWRPVEGLSLVAGSRELYSLKDGFLWLGKAGVRWNFWRGMYLRTRVTRNYRQPTVRELYLPYPVANPDLRPETSLNWDATLGFEDFRHLEVSVTAYRSQARDLIRYFGSWPAAEVVNIDSIAVWGLEGRVRVRDLGPFGATVAGAWQRVGRYTRQNPEASIDFACSLGRQWGAHRLEGEVSGEWVHGLYMANYRRDRIADPFFLDLAVRYRYQDAGKDWTLEPWLVVRNLMNRKYEYLRGYEMPGAHVLAGLKVGLGR
ncbi:TonB-dependent receptor [Myxococcota bacterium]|nr:TonB-dependent receptor [Myxococcota bacterium]